MPAETVSPLPLAGPNHRRPLVCGGHRQEPGQRTAERQWADPGTASLSQPRMHLHCSLLSFLPKAVQPGFTSRLGTFFTTGILQTQEKEQDTHKAKTRCLWHPRGAAKKTSTAERGSPTPGTQHGVRLGFSKLLWDGTISQDAEARQSPY